MTDLRTPPGALDAIDPDLGPHTSDLQAIKQVGHTYPVRFAFGELTKIRGWWPVVGRAHDDGRDGVGHRHFTVDWRFVPDDAVRALMGFDADRLPRLALHCVLADYKAGRFDLPVQIRGAEMVREAPGLDDSIFNVKSEVSLAAMENRHRDDRLLPGFICPHNGTPVLEGRRISDTVFECPSHGLRWDIATGEMCPRTHLGPGVNDFHADCQPQRWRNGNEQRTWFLEHAKTVGPPPPLPPLPAFAVPTLEEERARAGEAALGTNQASPCHTRRVSP
jgi:nitrite reductase/ring-hydroxylating ferredoxin subunit